MTAVDLATEQAIDFADVELGYEAFRRLAVNPHLSEHGRIGFPDTYRSAHERSIFEDICAKLPALAGHERVVLDIGPGCANLPRLIIGLCQRQSHRLHLLDSPEMLAQLPDHPFIRKTAGAFPASSVGAIAPGSIDVVICYSVLHYMFMEINLFHVVDRTVELLAPGGAALFGDIPNHSKRKRFFASEAGRAYHKAFTCRDEAPEVPHFAAVPGKIDDSVLLAMVQRAQQAGCDAYLLPQPRQLPMANRRDDLLIMKP